MSRNKWIMKITRISKDLCKKIAFENFVPDFSVFSLIFFLKWFFLWSQIVVSLWDLRGGAFIPVNNNETWKKKKIAVNYKRMNKAKPEKEFAHFWPQTPLPPPGTIPTPSRILSTIQHPLTTMEKRSFSLKHSMIRVKTENPHPT